MVDNRKSTAVVVALLTNHGEPFLDDESGEAVQSGEYIERFVINSGQAQGVKNGDKYLIYALGEEIIDPSSGKSLGQLEVVRGRASVIHAQENMSILKSDEKKMVRIPDPFNPTFGQPKLEPVDEALRVLDVGDFARPV